MGFLILYCILSWCDDGFQGSTFEFIWTKNCKKNFLKEIYTKKRKRWWKEKKIRVNLVGKMITFFVLLSGTAKKCFYFAERKMERKLKMDVKSNLDRDYIVKISSSKKGQYKPKYNQKHCFYNIFQPRCQEPMLLWLKKSKYIWQKIN